VTPQELTVPQALELAVQVHRKGYLDGAQELYQRVLAEVPDHPDALNFLGVLRFQLGDRERGIELVSRALTFVPDHVDARNNLGNMLLAAGRLAEAEAAYAQVLALRPQHADTHANIGMCRRRRDDLPGAEEAFRAAIAINPDHGEAFHNLGVVLEEADRPTEALAAYQRALQLRPYHPESYRLFGAQLIALGRNEDAKAVYTRWLELEPNNAVAAHHLAALGALGVPARASDGYVAKTFDMFADSFDKVLGNLDYRAPALIAEAVAALLGAPAATLDVLDAGAGTGWCGPLLRPYARTLVGVDLSPAMLEKAKARAVYDQLEVAELTAFIEARPGAFDLIASADTLVYFGDLTAVLTASARALRPGGLLAFTIEHALEEPPDGHLLNPHGRYSHGQAYVERALAAAGFSSINLTPAQLRTEGRLPVNGLVVTARKPGG